MFWFKLYNIDKLLIFYQNHGKSTNIVLTE